MKNEKPKDDQQTTIHERVSQLVDHFSKGNKTSFGKETGILPGVLASITGGRLSKPSFELLQKIMARFPSINGNWLLMGRGSMLQDEIAKPDISSLSITEEQSKVILKQYFLEYIQSEPFQKLMDQVSHVQTKKNE